MDKKLNPIRLLALAGAVAAPATAGELAQTSGAWLQAVAEGSLKFVDPRLERGRLWLEGVSRWDEDWSHWYQGTLRAALGYSLDGNATLWAGYTYVPTQALGKPTVQQQEAWAGFRYALPTNFGLFTYRHMLEADFIPGNHGDVRFRDRQLFRFHHPLQTEPSLSLVAWDEVFVRLNTTPAGGQSGFDQNRLFAGLGWTLSAYTHCELGYMNQYQDDGRHVNAGMQHLLSATLFIHF